MKMNPFQWSADQKGLANLLAIITAIAGGSAWIVNTSYAVAEKYTVIDQNLRQAKVQLTEVKEALVAQDGARDKVVGALKAEVVPRITDLEKAVNVAQAEAAATKQRVTDMKDDLDAIKTITQRSLVITQSHDEDIRATRRAVAPRAGDRPAVP